MIFLCKTSSPIPALFAVASAVCAFSASLAAQPADLVFHGGTILTMVDDATNTSAIAVSAERIVAIGDEALADKWVGPNTRVIDLGTRALLPGFIDAHGHITLTALATGWANLAPPPVGPVGSIAQLQETLQQHAKEQNPTSGDWVIGFGYDDSLMQEKRHPIKADLDELFPDNPVLLIHVSGHLAALNSRGLEQIEVSADTADPPGGIIRRIGDTQEPDGVLEESAFFRVYSVLPTPSLEQSLLALDRAQALYASHGITTAQDGATTPPGLSLLQAAAQMGRLKMDLVTYPMGVDLRDSQVEKLTFGSYQGRLKTGGIKLTLDGSPQGKTAFLSTPFLVPPKGQAAGYRGYPAMPQDEVDKQVARFLPAGIPILAHANGDAAADQLLHAIEAALPAASSGAKRPDHRTVVIHAQITRDDQLDRYLELGMIPSFFAAHSYYWGDWHRDSVLGYQRAERISPAQAALQRGIRFTLHNDAPIVPPDILRLIWASVNRRTRSGDILGPGQRISVLDAIRAVTIDAAFQYFEEDQKGSLETGKLADLVILSANPLTHPPAELFELRVEETFSKGNSIFRRHN